MSGVAFADGKHKAKFKVKNDSAKAACIWVYNGKDTSKSSAHKKYWVKSGDEVTAKCHGQGKGRCKYESFVKCGGGQTKCFSLLKTDLVGECKLHLDTNKISKGKTVTITDEYQIGEN